MSFKMYLYVKIRKMFNKENLFLALFLIGWIGGAIMVQHFCNAVYSVIYLFGYILTSIMIVVVYFDYREWLICIGGQKQ